jgi:hypothetical protein
VKTGATLPNPYDKEPLLQAIYVAFGGLARRLLPDALLQASHVVYVKS